MRISAGIFVVAATAVSTSAFSQPQREAWLVCRTTLDVTRYVAPPVLVAAADIPAMEKEFRKLADSVGNKHTCTSYAALEEVPKEEKAGSAYPAAWGGGTISVVAFPNLPETWGRATRSVTKRASHSAQPQPSVPPKAPEKPVAASAKYVEVPGPNGMMMRLSPEVAARNKAAADEYARKMQEHAETVARIRDEEQANAARHAERVAKAAEEKREYERKLAANAAEVAAQKAIMDDHQKKLAAKASTDDDPNRCITSPAIKPGLRRNTEVHVTNGCDQKIDIVICLKRTSGDWLCGARHGLLSQRKMSFMSTNATGEIYVDAVTFGSGQKLGRPAGIIK